MKKAKAKASVIIPYYKKKNTIEQSIKSVISQTYSNFEIILIYDDEDRSDLVYLKKLKRLDKRIRIIVNKKNLGAGLSRNIGILNSRGKYICFLDADDIWNKHKLLLQINFMFNENCNVSHTTYEVRDITNKKIKIRKARNFRNCSELLPSCDIGLSTVVVEKKIFKSDIRFSNQKTKEDFILWLTILKNNIQIIGFDKKLVSRCLTKNSLSSSVIQKLRDGYFVYNRFMKFNFFKSLFFLFLLSFNSLFK